MLYYTKSLILLLLIIIASNGYAHAKEMKILSDISYGKDADQTLDVYAPIDVKNAPVIFMVHGGAWSGGDKANKAEFKNKVAHWVTKGFIFISINYRTLPKVRPVEQTKDLETALIFSQKSVREWGGSPEQFILMGHSSGAHLISLVSSNYQTIVKNGAIPWIGTVSLDISGYDIVKKVTGAKPSEFYIEKFGENLLQLQKASPFHALTDKIPPFLAICSLRSNDACTQAENFIEKAKSFGGYAYVMPVDMSHREINLELGKDACYTKAVDDFFKKLNSSVKSMFIGQDTQQQKMCIDS